MSDETRRSEQAVVMLQTDDEGIGAGVMIGYDNENIYIVTAFHVVENHTQVTVRLKQSPQARQGFLVSEHINVDLDLAMVRLPRWANFSPKEAIDQIKVVENVGPQQQGLSLYAFGNVDPRVGWDFLDALSLNRISGDDVFVADNG
ncbi:MAG: hypothetical protein AAF629_36010, partial [Chloroflexota bacterium]